LISLKNINKATSIVLLTNNDSFANASAIYTYILTLHKKVSLVCEDEELDNKLSCIPWFKKLRRSVGSSHDLVIDVTLENSSLYEWFKINNIKINKKISTALYVSLLQDVNYFVSDISDGIIFAYISELILCGADYSVCNQSFLHNVSLSIFRLKSKLFAEMVLHDNAKVIVLFLSKDDLSATGTSLRDAYLLMIEALNIAHVKTAVLLDKDLDYELLKLIVSEKF